jgi:hypothetical protein
MEAGGEIGGECMSAAQGAELDSCSVGSVNMWSNVYVTASFS